MRKKILVAASLIFLLLGVVFTSSGVNMIISAKESVAWPVAEGRIHHSKIIETVKRRTSGQKGQANSKSYHAKVEYEYIVSETKYSSNQISFGKTGSNKPEYARQLVNQYPKGKIVDVYYDPEDPETAVLVPGKSLASYAQLLVGVILTIISCLLFFRRNAAHGTRGGNN